MVSLFIWFRASFPRYRYDQIMRLGWKVFIPITLVWLILIAIWMQTPWNIWTWVWTPTLTSFAAPSGAVGTFGTAGGPEYGRDPRIFRQPAAQGTDQGLALTGRYAFRAQDHDPVPGGRDADQPTLPRSACAAPLSERRGTLHRLQAVRGGLPGAGHHDRIRPACRRYAPHDALRHRPHQVHLLRVLRGELPCRLDRRNRHPRVPRRRAW